MYPSFNPPLCIPSLLLCSQANDRHLLWAKDRDRAAAPRKRMRSVARLVSAPSATVDVVQMQLRVRGAIKNMSLSAASPLVALYTMFALCNFASVLVDSSTTTILTHTTLILPPSPCHHPHPPLSPTTSQPTILNHHPPPLPSLTTLTHHSPPYHPHPPPSICLLMSTASPRRQLSCRATRLAKRLAAPLHPPCYSTCLATISVQACQLRL